jgi:hypothetical protein
MAIQEWRQQWESIRRALLARGAFFGRWDRWADKPPRFEIDPPATIADVLAVESELGQAIPQSLRRVILEFSSRVCIEWQLRDSARPQGIFRSIFAGECRWDLRSLPALKTTHQEWVEGCFTGEHDPGWKKPPHLIKYDLVWRDKFAFLEVGKGEMVAIAVATPASQPVVYLSHDDASVTDITLARTSRIMLDRLTALAFVGAEDWQLAPFSA